MFDPALLVSSIAEAGSDPRNPADRELDMSDSAQPMIRTPAAKLPPAVGGQAAGFAGLHTFVHGLFFSFHCLFWLFGPRAPAVGQDCWPMGMRAGIFAQVITF